MFSFHKPNIINSFLSQYVTHQTQKSGSAAFCYKIWNKKKTITLVMLKDWSMYCHSKFVLCVEYLDFYSKFFSSIMMYVIFIFVITIQ